MFSKFHAFEKRYGLGTLGFVIGLISAGFAVYVEYFRFKGPNLAISVLNDFDVISLKEDLPDLQMTHQGVDLRSKGQKLRVMLLQVANTGSGDLSLASYDTSDLPGLAFNGGKIIRVERGSASSEYLQAKFDPKKVNDGLVEFSPMMMDSGESATFKVLLLVDSKSAVTVKAKGKVLGVRSIIVNRADEPATSQGFWSEVFSGSALVHLVRAVNYTAIFMFALLLIVAPTVAISDKLAERKRRRAAQDFKSLTELKLTDRHDFIFKLFEEDGVDGLALVVRATDSPADFDKLRMAGSRKFGVAGPVAEPGMSPAVNSVQRIVHGNRERILTDLLRVRFLSKEGDAYVVDPDMKIVLDAFARFLKRRKMFPESQTGSDVVDADFEVVN